MTIRRGHCFVFCLVLAILIATVSSSVNVVHADPDYKKSYLAKTTGETQNQPINHPHNSLLPLSTSVSQISWPSPLPVYDEQLGLTFTQNFSSMAYNVTAVAQSDTYGYGPAYLLNGLSDSGYWYQVGLSYNWPHTWFFGLLGGYTPGFNFDYEVFNASGSSVFPSNGQGGLSSFSGPVNSGDTVLLTLSFINGNVLMYSRDWNTGSFAYQTYSSEAATFFMGLPNSYSNGNGFFSGLMTEWWHGDPYYGNEKAVTYFNYAFALTSAWMWIDEWEPSNTSWTGGFSNVMFIQYTLKLNQLQLFSYYGATEYSSAYAFITGMGVLSISVSPSSALLDVGQSQLFTANVTYGTPPYMYQWYLNSALVSSTSSTWTFTPTSAGSYTVYVEVTDSVGMQAASNFVTVTVNGGGEIHDVAITNATLFKTVVGLGYSTSISLTVADLSSYTEPFNVTVYANDTLIGTSTVIDLPTGMSTGLNFGWNTAGFANGSYTLSANISLVAGETNMGNNTYMCGHIAITIPGDINGDFKVNLLDLVEIVQAYNSKLGDSNWNPNADIDGNGKVDLVDLIIIATNYGKTV